MADIVAEITELEGVADGFCLELKGHLDDASLPRLQDAITEVETRGARFLAIDASGIRYINRAAFMFLVDVSRRLQAKEGALALCGLNENIKAMFHMLGLEAFVTVVDDIKAAAALFASGSTPVHHAGLPVSDALAQDVAETQKGIDIDAALEMVSHDAVSEELAGELGAELEIDLDDELAGELDESADAPVPGIEEDEAHVPGDTTEFPVYQLCAYCSANLRVNAPGNYRCPRCGALFRVGEDATAEFLESLAPRPVRMELNTSQECSDAMLAFLDVIARHSLPGHPAADELLQAVSALCVFIREKAYRGSTEQSCQAFIAARDGELVLEMADSGDRVETGELESLVSPLVDYFEAKPRLGGGNFYKIVKRVELPDEQ